MTEPLDISAIEAWPLVRTDVPALCAAIRKLAKALGDQYCDNCSRFIQHGNCYICADARAALAEVKL